MPSSYLQCSRQQPDEQVLGHHIAGLNMLLYKLARKGSRNENGRPGFCIFNMGSWGSIKTFTQVDIHVVKHSITAYESDCYVVQS